MSRRSRSPMRQSQADDYYRSIDKKTFSGKVDNLVKKHKDLERILKVVTETKKNHTSYVPNPSGSTSKFTKADYRSLSSQFVKELKDLKKIYNNAKKKKKRVGSGNQSGNSPILINSNMAKFFESIYITDPVTGGRFTPQFPTFTHGNQTWYVSTRNQITRLFNLWVYSSQSILQGGDTGIRIGSAYINVTKSPEFMRHLSTELNMAVNDANQKKSRGSPRRMGGDISQTHFKSIYITKLLSYCSKRRGDLDEVTLRRMNDPSLLTMLQRDQSKVMELRDKYNVALAVQKEQNRKYNQEQSKLKRSRRSTSR